MRSLLSTTTRSLEESLLSNLRHLDPTSDATAKHQKRVYHTIQSWCGNNLPPEQWGWKMSNGMCLLVQITKPPARHELLKVITCGCKIEYTTRCTCVTYGLKYTSI